MVSGRRGLLRGGAASAAPLPVCEQVSRGQELLQMLKQQPVSSDSCDVGREEHTHEDEGVDVEVIVKHGFIEVIDPQCRRRMNRSMSDSALLSPTSMSEQPWQKISSDKFLDLSDASTTISNDAEETPEDYATCVRKDTCWSDDEGNFEMSSACMPYQYYGDSWWMMNMGYDASGAMMMCTSMQEGDMYMSSTLDDFSTACPSGEEWRTTVMLRNMPNNYTRDMLLELVDVMGFSGRYDFAYLPVDFKSQAGLGYAFINFVSTAEAQRCFECFEGFSDWKVPSEKVCTVTWGAPYQGLEAHIERYQNSPVMHHSIPDEWKPVLLEQGVRIVFPPPTKPIKTPKVRAPPADKLQYQ